MSSLSLILQCWIIQHHEAAYYIHSSCRRSEMSSTFKSSQIPLYWPVCYIPGNGIVVKHVSRILLRCDLVIPDVQWSQKYYYSCFDCCCSLRFLFLFYITTGSTGPRAPRNWWSVNNVRTVNWLAAQLDPLCLLTLKERTCGGRHRDQATATPTSLSWPGDILSRPHLDTLLTGEESLVWIVSAVVLVAAADPSVVLSCTPDHILYSATVPTKYLIKSNCNLWGK